MAPQAASSLPGATRGSAGYTNISEEVSGAPSTPGRAWARAAAALAAAVAAAAATAAWLKVGHSHRLRTSPEAEPLQLQEAGTLAEGVEFNVDGGWYQSMDHIPSAELCQVLCTGEPKCDLFTWVEDALPDGCKSQCWLKGGQLKYEAQKAGVTSGYPLPRRMLPEIEAPAAGPTLYCWALSAPTGNEPEMLNWQAEKKVGPFQCEKAAIYSNQAVKIGGMTALVIDSDMKCEYGGDSQSALNSWIFIAAWDKVLDTGDYRSYEWTVKVDADAVFFPNRLKSILANHAGAPYLSNCKYGLHGPIEVFSTAALNRLAQDYQASFDGKSPHSCVEGLDFGEYGEDMFIDQCLSKILQVGQPPVDPMLICEDHCECPDFYKCNANDFRVSFHPMKSISSYHNCMANALNGPTATAGYDFMRSDKALGSSKDEQPDASEEDADGSDGSGDDDVSDDEGDEGDDYDNNDDSGDDEEQDYDSEDEDDDSGDDDNDQGYDDEDAADGEDGAGDEDDYSDDDDDGDAGEEE